MKEYITPEIEIVKKEPESKKKEYTSPTIKITTIKSADILLTSNETEPIIHGGGTQYSQNETPVIYFGYRPFK